MLLYAFQAFLLEEAARQLDEAVSQLPDGQSARGACWRNCQAVSQLKEAVGEAARLSVS